MGQLVQKLINPEDTPGGVYTRKVAMHCLWTMHDRGRFRPRSVLNVGVGAAHELGIWKWMLPKVPVLGIDPREAHQNYRRNKKFHFVQAIAGDVDGTKRFCSACRSIQCKSQAEHEALGCWHEMESVTLDKIVKDHGLEPPHFIWMDIDGGEVAALAGARQTLENTGWLCVELANWVPRHSRRVLHMLKRARFVLEVRFSMDALFRNSRFRRR